MSRKHLGRRDTTYFSMQAYPRPVRSLAPTDPLSSADSDADGDDVTASGKHVQIQSRKKKIRLPSHGRRRRTQGAFRRQNVQDVTKNRRIIRRRRKIGPRR